MGIYGKLDSRYFHYVSRILIDFQAQLRPSTGMYDQKESLWLQRNSQWPSDEDVPKFRETTESFMAKCASISDQVCKF